MEVVVLPTADGGAALVADAVVRLLRKRPAAVLGLATGSSPLRVYQELIHRCSTGEVTFAGARAFLLDEYVGLAPEHPQSYRSVIRSQLTDSIDLPPSAVHGLDGSAADLAEECQRYEGALVEAGGVDLQLLGIGTDGHLGFNEPGSSLASRTRLKTLTRQTREDNSRFFPSPQDVPRHVLTQGLGTILDAAHLVLVAAGSGKAVAVAAAVEGPVSASWPASVLQLHPHVSVVLDQEAAGQLLAADYYRQAWEGKPAWQQL